MWCLPFKVFIGYGEELGKEIAIRLGKYLDRKGFETFVASTDPRWMLPGQSTNIIYDRLRISDILVPVCTPQAEHSFFFRKETSLALTTFMPILPFKMRGSNVSFELLDIWCIDFDVNRPWAKHRDVADNIPRLIEWHNDNTRKIKESISGGT